ncbi:MAG: prepilin-type N-terminal cleavage/methylation domain-containing protein [Planctomycetes bacterium]|nr:prepilin-type N-terminal cleavage/methylation domain-containing protein [Planctomycetota bacterium]MCW8135237.1 prepilin-type N-terminal cleavage/methylation domain-containing protein [Planctomycetota bacterium]
MAMRAHRGFTLLELTIVIFILMLVLLAFGTFMGRAMAGPSIERHTASIKAMTASVRNAAAVRQVHCELVFDYRNDHVIALSRRRLTTFAFDSSADSPGVGGLVGSGGALATVSGGAFIQDDRRLGLRDGDCLELPSRNSGFTIPWMGQFSAGGGAEGLAISFDFCPMEEPGPTSGVGMVQPSTGNLVRAGNVFTLSVVGTRPDAVRLGLSSNGVVAESPTWLALYRWATVEVAVSAYGVSLYVDGRLTAGLLPDGFKPGLFAGTDIVLGGAPCRIDNFDLMGLVAGQVLELEGTHLIAPGVDPLLEVTGQAQGIYDAKLPTGGPVTGGVPDEPTPGITPGLPLVAPPGMVHVHFDGAGKLDPARHAGAVQIHMVSGDTDEIRRITLTFHPLGHVTHEVVDRFPWEEGAANE